MTDPTSRPKAAPTTPAPAVPDSVLAQILCHQAARRVGQQSPFGGPDWDGKKEMQARIDDARAIYDWAWHQRDDEVRAAEQRGADAELCACVEWVRGNLPARGDDPGLRLRNARRPPAPTLRERALEDLRERLSDDSGVIAMGRETAEQLLAALQEGADG